MRSRYASCFFALVSALLGLLASPASGTDGCAVLPPVPPGPTYYEEKLTGTSTAAALDPSGPLPDRLHPVEGTGQVEYRRVEVGPEQAVWEVVVRGFERRHEQVDAVYDMILVLPLPVDARGADAFTALGRGIQVKEGPLGKAVSLVYGNERIVLKRNSALEKTLLPRLAGDRGESDKLPSLAGTGFRYTAWDAIVTRDPSYGDTVQAWASFRFTAAASVAAPDADDSRLAAWCIVWIPSLTAEIPPYAVRMDLVETPL